MSNGNGSKWTLWLAGLLTTALTTALFTLGNAVVANDRDSRSRDEKLREEQVSALREQTMVNQQILLSLAELETDIKYIKHETSNGTGR